MIKIFYIFFLLLVTASAVMPKDAVVTCKKEDGSVTIEFKSGESCSCDEERISDLLKKNCCDITECHNNEKITSDCHDKNQINSGDCDDTELQFIDVLNTFNRNNIYLTTNSINFLTFTFAAPSSLRGLIKPVDVGKYSLNNSEIINQSLLFKKTTVFII